MSAAQFLTLAEKQGATAPLLMAHRFMGISLLYTGDITEGRTHLEQAIALYDTAEHRPLATRFGLDAGVHALSYRPWALWMLGYPNAALADLEHALSDAREIGQAATLMVALVVALLPHICCGNYEAGNQAARRERDLVLAYPTRCGARLSRRTSSHVRERRSIKRSMPTFSPSLKLACTRVKSNSATI